MTPPLATIPTPTSSDCAARIAWAGEMLADLADGTLPMSAAPVLVAYLLGFADLCTADEERQYRAIAGRIDAMGAAL